MRFGSCEVWQLPNVVVDCSCQDSGGFRLEASGANRDAELLIFGACSYIPCPTLANEQGMLTLIWTSHCPFLGPSGVSRMFGLPPDRLFESIYFSSPHDEIIDCF